MLMALLSQLRRNKAGDWNNGDLCATWRIMNERHGFRSRGTLCKALRELETAGWIVRTRQGGMHQASLFALTFFAIDFCKGKLDIASTATPSDDWRTTFDDRHQETSHPTPCKCRFSAN